MIQDIINYSNRLINNTNSIFVRYLDRRINWESRLIEVYGARGVGKTTLLLQRAHTLNEMIPNQAVFLSLDDLLFFSHSIVEVAESLKQYGVNYLFLDEVHKYPSKYPDYDWSAEIKNCYDRLPDLSIVYSGSSVLKLNQGEGDLSRRKSSYLLSGLSFREYLTYNKMANYEPFSLEEILVNHEKISGDITKSLKIIPLFKEYLKTGYYPFYNEDPPQYYDRINSILNVIIENDIPAVTEIPFETSQKIKKLLAAIASSVPYVPNLVKLRTELRISDQRTLLKYLDYLEKAEVLFSLSQKVTGNKILQKPDKLYLGNPNYFYSLNLNNAEIGSIRESFFASQLSVNHELRLPKKGDFLIDNKYVFEIGGKNKNSNQLTGESDAWFALDDLEIGFKQIIPLWLFGFIY